MNIVYEHETGNRSYNRKGTDHTEERFQNNNMQKEMIVRQMRDRGCRITKARLTLLDVILGQDCSSCKEIYYIASQMIPGIGIATVYRMMNLLEEIGAITRNSMYQIACARECEIEDACTVELDDDTIYHLSAKKWNAVVREGLKVCGYMDTQNIRAVTVRQCECAGEFS